MRYLIAFLMTCGVAMAGDLGVLYNQAYRGTHGVAVSNLAAAATTNAPGTSAGDVYPGDAGAVVSNLAAAALPKAGGEVTGYIYFGGTNVARLGMLSTNLIIQYYVGAAWTNAIMFLRPED